RLCCAPWKEPSHEGGVVVACVCPDASPLVRSSRACLLAPAVCPGGAIRRRCSVVPGEVAECPGAVECPAGHEHAEPLPRPDTDPVRDDEIVARVARAVGDRGRVDEQSVAAPGGLQDDGGACLAVRCTAERIPLEPGHDEYLPRGDGKAGSLSVGVERQVERRLTRAAACVAEAPKRDRVDELAGLLGPEFGMRERTRDDERKC